MADLMTLSAGQRALLQREIEQVLSRPPSVTDSTISIRAAEVLARRSSFGTRCSISFASRAAMARILRTRST
jgi:hypothetical protein